MEFDAIRATEFRACTENGIFLNHAGVSPYPASVVKAVMEAAEWSAKDPHSFFTEMLLPNMRAARRGLAGLMGVPSAHLAFTRNTGHGLSIIADGLDLAPGDNVVMADCEYPAVTYPWMAQSSRGIEVRWVATRPDGTIALDDVAAVMDSHTRAIVVSWVQFGTGFRVDLKAWTDLAHAHNALIIADVIQGLGVFPLESESIGLDIVATGAHKWLIAPAGVGGLYIAPHVLDRVRLVNMGACSVVDIGAYEPKGFHPKPTAQRYEEGTANSLGLCGLNAALTLIGEMGLDNITRRVLDLTHHAIDAVTARGYIVTSPRDDASRSGLVLFRHPTLPNEAILKVLEKHNISAAIRGGSLRFSPHFYNTFDDIDRAIAVLPE